LGFYLVDVFEVSFCYSCFVYFVEKFLLFACRTIKLDEDKILSTKQIKEIKQDF